MPDQELLQSALNQRYEKYVTEYAHCIAAFSGDAVHDLRVAVRRMLALIYLLRDIAPQLHLKKLRRTLKAQLDSLDDLRDTQVMLEELSQMVNTLPELAALQKYLQKREKRLLCDAQSAVIEFETGHIARRIEKVRSSLAEQRHAQDLIEQLLQIVDKASLQVLRRIRHVDANHPASIHRVRIAFKKFRYMLEIIYPILPDFPENYFKRMHDYQAAMGQIQDVEVLLKTLDVFSARHKAYDPRPVQRFYEQRHADLISNYLKNMSEFVSFWRSTPDHPFPWEIQAKELP